MVNRLLDCKEIDVNLQNMVGGNVLISPHPRLSPKILALILFGCDFFNEKFLFDGQQKKTKCPNINSDHFDTGIPLDSLNILHVGGVGRNRMKKY